ncbi:Ribosomal protein S6 kinase alpha-4 [Geranomyces variabilis]|uniref:non-specific serine/threonine protein kinase n=1 Tax=Geranomyces variabilis TaxID=109894 RepID=A0AAD5XQW9_9FUNG|nr:Ribosomal protein S6 kinase alpha-4 [Geranomyces variabilis]
MSVLSLDDLRSRLPSVNFDEPFNALNAGGRSIGEYIVQWLPITFAILESTDVPSDFIVNFARAGLRDKGLPFTQARLLKVSGLPDEFTEDYRAGQALFLAVSFAPREYKVLSHYESVPFQLVWRSPRLDGSFAVVEHVKEGNVSYARKTVDLALARSHLRETQACIERELAILRIVPNHPHLVKMRAAYTQEKKTVFVLSPWATTDLAAFFAKKETLDWWKQAVHANAVMPMIDSWCVCIASALFTLHKAHIKHRDLKPENVLLHKTDDAVIPVLCDYGLERNYSGSSLSHKTVGAVMYGSPEQNTARKVGRKADVFSFGAILVELYALLGGIPMKKVRRFSNPSYAYSIMQGDNSALISLFPSDTPAWLQRRSILAAALSPEPEERPSSQEIWARLDAVAPGSHCPIPPQLLSPLTDDGRLPADSSSDSDSDVEQAVRFG